MKSISRIACGFFIIICFWQIPSRAFASDVGAEIERRALAYFREQSNPISGLTLDSADDFGRSRGGNRMASVAATGFSLAVYANAASQGFIPDDEARAYLIKTLRFARDHVPRRKGWFTHFLDWETGEPFPGSEFSTIDTALFVAGALYAAQVYPDTEIARVANQLYEEMDYPDMLTDGGGSPQKKTLSMAYNPGSGYTPSQWDMPAEEMLLYLLGIGHPIHPLPRESWFAWRRDALSLADGSRLIGGDMPLFVHQYSEDFIDLSALDDGIANYAENARAASRFNRSTCLSDARFLSFRAGFWGLSAGLTPEGYGGEDPVHYTDGTVCIGCAIGSVMYDRETILSDAKAWIEGPYRDHIWGRYGFIDSLDLDRPWFARSVLGITVGPEYLAVANSDSKTSIWRLFNTRPEIRRAFGVIAAH